MTEPYERLQDARRSAGFTQAVDAARAFGWPEVTYRAHENGIRGLRRQAAERYAQAFGVSTGWLLTGEGDGPGAAGTASSRPARRPISIPVIGKAAAGVYREVIEYQDDDLEYVFDVPDPEFPNARRFSIDIEGDSLNDLRPRPILDGDRVVCVDFEETGIPLEHSALVAVERFDGDKREWTVKQVEILPDGRVQLCPRSTNKRWKPFPYADDPDAEKEVRVFGLVRSVIADIPRGSGRRR